MEEDDGLELSLGLSCGGSSGKSKTSDVVPPCHSLGEGNNNALVGHNMNVLDTSLDTFFAMGESQDHDRKQKTEWNSHQSETFFSSLGECSAPAADESNYLRYESQVSQYQDLWASNNKTADTEKEKSALNKRKLTFDDIDLERKFEKASYRCKTPTDFTSGNNSRVSATSVNASVGENEDVAESEAEGSSSRYFTQRESSRCFGDPYTDKHVLTDHKLLGSGNKPQSELEKVAHGMPLSVQAVTVSTVPYQVPAKAPTNATVLSSPSIMPVMPLAKEEHQVIQTMNTNDFQLSLDCSTVQLPTLQTGLPWATCSRPTQTSSFFSSDFVNGASKLDQLENDVKIPHASVLAPDRSAETLTYEKHVVNLVEDGGKQVGEVAQTEDKGDSNNSLFRMEGAANQLPMEGFSHEGSSIRRGITSNVKFEGSGSHPDLPWVSTTGAGPNGKTISGVTYKYNKNQIKIVCACHGSHMSQEEFIQHAKAEDTNTKTNTILG